MRRSASAWLLAGLLTTAGLPAAAQDEDLRMGDDPAYFQRIEVPEAGIAVSYPPDWDVSVEMEYGQTQPGDPYTGRWYVARGSREDDSCSVYWYLYPGPSTAELAAESEGAWVNELGGELIEVELPIGAATSFVHPSLTGDDYTTSYEIDADGMRWALVCFSDEREPDDWLDIAETLEWLPAEDRLRRALEPRSEGTLEWSPGSYELERVELPEVGVAMELPLGWEIDGVMEEHELALPPGLVDEGSISYVDALHAADATGDWCDLEIHHDTPLTPREHAEVLASTWLVDDPQGLYADVRFTVVGAELGEQVDLLSEESMGLARAHIWDSGPLRLVLTCGTDLVFNRDWVTMAGSIELLPDGPEPDAEPTPEDLDAVGESASGQRVEVPEAGIAMTLPGGWMHETVMEAGEFQLAPEFADGSIVPYTFVSTASVPDGPMCILSTYEDMPLSLARHGLERGQTNTPSSIEIDPIINEVQRSAGPAVRVDFRSMLGWGHEYLFDMAGLRYVLSCFDIDLGDETFWPIADSIESLDTGAAQEPETTDPSEASIDERRVEFSEFGIGLTIPGFWTYEPRREETEYPLPGEFGEDATVSRTQFLTAFPFTEGVCWVSTFDEMPMDPERHALEHGWAHYSSFSETTPETARVQLPAGEAYRVVYHAVFGGAVAYTFDLAGSRYLVECVVGDDGGFAARSLGASITALGDEPPELWLQRLEFADADIELTLPVEWEVQSVMQFLDTINVAGPDTLESDLWTVMSAFPDEQTWCELYRLSNRPLSLEDHGYGFATAAELKDPPGEATTESLTLPIGDAVRVVETSDDGPFVTYYLFDVGESRNYLVCSTPEQPEDAWLSVAESIESLSDPSAAPGPDAVVTRSALTDVVTVLPVTGGDDGETYLQAACDHVSWVEYADGWFEERLECLLTDEPVDPPEDQGRLPQEQSNLGGGECEWVSDYWFETDGSEVWASSWSVVVDDDGRATAQSWYAPEELVCEG